jgi:DNA modification methylase
MTEWKGGSLYHNEGVMIMGYQIFNCDCLEWLKDRPSNSIHAVVTDPPFGMREYTPEEIKKLRAGRGGIWRIPPEIGGSKRLPLPRFTVLTEEDLAAVFKFFQKWGKEIYRVMVPGAHLFIACNPLISHIIYNALVSTGLEKRGEIIRLVRTLRGGDRPKGAELEFDGVSAMPRACYEPWGLFRKPLEGRLAENLKKWWTGGLRRPSKEKPFTDVIESGRTPQEEREIAPHPSLKPQRFMRQIVYASLPLGKGVVLDPFMGAGSTIAAAEAVGYDSIGIEIDKEYFDMAKKAIPLLARIPTDLGIEVSTVTGQLLFAA